MKRASMNRAVVRRADAGVDSLSVNGGTPLTGDVSIRSPMATEQTTPPTIFIDNANRKVLTLAPVTADINTDLNNAFSFPQLAGPLVVPVPQAPAVGSFEFRKITFSIISRGNPADTVTFTGGANGFNFPVPSRPGAVGPFLTDLNAVLAGMQNNDMLLVGFEFHSAQSVTGPWLFVAMSGPYAK